MQVIAFGHRRRMGKDTCGDILVETRGYSRLSFAEPVYNIVGRLQHGASPTQVHRLFGDYGLPDAWATELLAEVYALSSDMFALSDGKPRRLLQWVGTEFGRKRDPDIWVKLLIRRMLAQQGRYVVTDLRFRNEAAGLREHNALLVRVTRLGVDTNQADLHESERDLEGYPFDVVLENNGTLDELAAKVQDIAVRYESTRGNHVESECEK